MLRAVLFILVSCRALPGVDLVPCQETLVQGAVCEWRLEGVPKAWLTSDVLATPSLVLRQGGGAVTRRSFLYQPYMRDGGRLVLEGQPHLRLRHRFDQAGTASWDLYAPGIDGRSEAIVSGEGQVVPSARPMAVVGISRWNPRLLAERGGIPFIPLGCNLAWSADETARLETMHRFMTRLAESGGNHLRLWCASWSGQIEGDAPDAYRQEQAWLLDAYLAEARRLGLRTTLALDNHHDVLRGLACPYGGDLDQRVAAFFAAPVTAQYQRRIRYLMARYAADSGILAWELFNEIDEALGPAGAKLADAETRALAWVQAAGDLVRDSDPDRHLITLSLAKPLWRRVINADRLDLVQFHAYVPPPAQLAEHEKDGVLMLAREVVELNNSCRPYCFSEVGHQGTNEDNPGNAADTAGMLLRQQAWAGLMLGGYGTAMNWWWDVYIEKNGLWPIYRPLAQAVARLDWRDTGLAPLTPNAEGSLRVIGWKSATQALIWPQVRSDTWYAQVIERRPRPAFRFAGPAVGLDGFTPGRSFAILALDMTDGRQRFVRRVQTDVRGGLVILLPESCNDLVLVVLPDQE